MKIIGRYILKCHCLWGGFYFNTLGREVDEGFLSRDEHKRITLLLTVLRELLECCEEL